ncbi:glutathione S-transferase family protein [Caballeronia sp. M23-90]
MISTTATLYESSGSPHSRRVRIFIAEKGLTIPVVSIDLGKGEQHSDKYRAINPRRVVPTLVIEDEVAIGEVPAILRYLEEAYPETPLHGATPKERALVTMWERRAELEGFIPAIESVRNRVVGLKGRAIAGPHDYEQIPELVERSALRVRNFFKDLDSRLSEVPFVAGDHFSVADITAFVTVDFAKAALNYAVPTELNSITRWYSEVAKRPGAVD